MRARIKFEKTGAVKYVGHLDLMRYFQKAVKRAEINIKYSEGFNPHQIMSFSSPLGVGLTSIAEYMDIEINDFIPSKAAVDALNKQMVEGLKIVSFKYLPDDAVKCMSALTAAFYKVTYKNSADCAAIINQVEDAKTKFFDESAQINIIKETKKGTRELDLKPLIYKFDVSVQNENIIYDLLLSSGSTDNIKPELVIYHLHKFLGQELDDMSLAIERTEMYTGEPDGFIALGDIGDEK